ncbi:MAG: hypothetical protein OXI55_12400 [Gammaproteobacteria bacterium]|nr:hypothetical protein [Gammaproteobacteria bacterium]
MTDPPNDDVGGVLLPDRMMTDNDLIIEATYTLDGVVLHVWRDGEPEHMFDDGLEHVVTLRLNQYRSAKFATIMSKAVTVAHSLLTDVDREWANGLLDNLGDAAMEEDPDRSGPGS